MIGSRFTLALLLVGLCLSANAGSKRHGIGQPDLIDRPWLVEAEFDDNSSLHARVDQVVALHLEPSTKQTRGPIKNRIRLAVEESRDFRFCIPQSDLHLLRIKVKRAGGGTVVNQRRGRQCKTVTLDSGLYELEIHHDGSKVDQRGQTAFFHQPTLQGGLTDSSVPIAPDFDFMAFREQNGEIVTNQTNQAGQIAATATTVGPSEVWRVTSITKTKAGPKFKLENGTKDAPQLCRDGNGGEDGGQMFTVVSSPSEDSTTVCNRQDEAVPTQFREYRAASPFEFYLNVTYVDSTTWIGGPVRAGTDNFLLWENQVGTILDTFVADYKGYDCTTPCDDSVLPLASGEIALYAQCDFQGPAMVFAAKVDDLFVYDKAAEAKLAIGKNMARSIRLGPDTVSLLYSEPNQAGTALTTASDIPCLDDTELGNDALDSFDIVQTSAVDYVVSSQGCVNCVLTGLDLSQQTFSGFNFSNTVFTNADLSYSDFTNTDLSQAVFATAGTTMKSTDFSGASLNCTNFWNADISGAVFTDVSFTTDFSCYVDLDGATLDFSNFDTASWRYLNLTGSTMQNVADILSTETAPLDLSGGVLNGVRWLAGKTLDSVNFGCVSVSNGATASCLSNQGAAQEQVCTCLQSTVFQDSSLQKANFENALLNGASLEQANLDQAIMSGAQLLQADQFSPSAVLSGAFMRGVKLDGANLTGVTADHINFFSTDTLTATAEGATMSSVNFSGAYLAGADFGDATLQSTNWTGAVLAGANFENANLEINAAVGSSTNFSGGFMHGTVFDSATVTGANFTSSYWDLDTFDAKALVVRMPAANLQFNGFWQDPTAAECVAGLYPNDNFSDPAPPATDSSNRCPDESFPSTSGCTFMEDPKTPIEDALPKTSVCTQDDVTDDSCQLPVAAATEQCTMIDACWTTPGFADNGTCLLN